MLIYSTIGTLELLSGKRCFNRYQTYPPKQIRVNKNLSIKLTDRDQICDQKKYVVNSLTIVYY